MGRHNRFFAHAPRPARVRFAVSRAAAITLVLVLIAWIGLSILFAPPQPSEELASVDAQISTPEETAAPAAVTESAGPEVLTVHVVGEVKNPGVYELAPGSRVNDAIIAAGGMTRQAKPELLNLASPLQDGAQILLPGPEALAAATPTGLRPMGSPEPSTPGSEASGRININQADAETLTRLPGIGPALAGRIIDFRESNGPFTSVEELDQVSGIGPVLVKRLEDLVQIP